MISAQKPLWKIVKNLGIFEMGIMGGGLRRSLKKIEDQIEKPKIEHSQQRSHNRKHTLQQITEN